MKRTASQEKAITKYQAAGTVTDISFMGDNLSFTFRNEMTLSYVLVGKNGKITETKAW